MTTDTSQFHPSPGSIPLHVGIIPDGGRRWGSAHQCPLPEVYHRTRQLMHRHVKHLLDYGVEEFSIYIASIQNFRREPHEVNAMLDALGRALEEEIRLLTLQHDLRVRMAGCRSILPESLALAIGHAEEGTRSNKNGKLNLLIAYDPLEEIRQAMRSAPTPERWIEKLWVARPVDLIIRTGGAMVMSNFLPLQSGFARLAFTDTLFNDFTQNELDEILAHFSGIPRKFGT